MSLRIRKDMLSHPSSEDWQKNEQSQGTRKNSAKGSAHKSSFETTYLEGEILWRFTQMLKDMLV